MCVTIHLAKIELLRIERSGADRGGVLGVLKHPPSMLGLNRTPSMPMVDCSLDRLEKLSKFYRC